MHVDALPFLINMLKGAGLNLVVPPANVVACNCDCEEGSEHCKTNSLTAIPLSYRENVGLEYLVRPSSAQE